MPRRAGPLALLVVFVALLPARLLAFTPIGVTVEERGGVERRRWPLTVSVPFARGEMRPDTPVKIVDAHGVSTPVQARPLATWPDDSVRWLLLDTQIALKPRQAQHLRVEPGRAPGPPAKLHVTESDDGVAIDTGVIRFTVPKKRFAIIDALRPQAAKHAPSGALSAILVAGERRGEAQAPARMALTDRGPLRARVELQGTYGNGFDYVVRVEAYAGQPFVRVWHTFINRFPTPYVSLPRIGLELPFNDPPPARYRFGVNDAEPRTGSLRDGLELFQVDNETHQVDGAAATGKLAGWIELDGPGATIGLASRWFWQEYPQSIAVRPDRLVYDLWAPQADPAKAGVGAAKTHEFVVWVAPPHAVARGAAAVAATPLLGVVDPARVAHSGALPLALSPRGAAAAFVGKAVDAARRYADRNATEVWEDCGAARCEDSGLGRRRSGAYGMWNWGDWNFRGYKDTTKGTDSWGNLEYDTALVLALAYAASGDAGVHDQMVAAARHFIDVDTIYACPSRPEWVGMNHPKNPLHFSFELGGPDLGHTWTQGEIAYFYLTGDERGLAAARGIADYLAARVRNPMRGNPRQWGWPQIALLAVHDATGERRYLDAALAYARGGMASHPPTASSQWKLGILADGLAYTHAATGDAAIRQWLQAYAAAVMKRRQHEDARAFPAVAYVAALTGDRAMREAARERVERIDLGGWGKPFTISGRIGFRIESLLNATK
jgi:hypothetical protein